MTRSPLISMAFTSFSYILFLPLVYLVFYVVSDRYRWLVLLTASYASYARFKAPQLIIALILVTAVSYACGIRLGRTRDGKQRTRIFCSGVAVCLLLLAGVKLMPRIAPFLGHDLMSACPNLLLSIGISYVSFQALSYLADIYLEVQEPEPHAGYLALSLAFFPKLLQGPIERAGELLPQLRQPYRFDYDAMRSGMLLFTWGLFKKVVVADRLALYADHVSNHVHDYTGVPLIVGTYAYALQIYFDFAGYTDMARGTARLFGINLTQNFNSPYLATSVADFWRRWHISFSRWLLDYLFRPLQMSWRGWGRAGTALALLVTFLISGLWHGVSSGFLVWGLLHGLYLASATFYRPYQKKLQGFLGVEKSPWLTWWQIAVTFNLVSFAWVFFRNGCRNGWYVVCNALNFLDNYAVVRDRGISSFVETQILMGMGTAEFWTLMACLAAILAVRKFQTVDIRSLGSLPRWAVYSTLVVSIVLFRLYDTKTDFIYFKF